MQRAARLVLFVGGLVLAAYLVARHAGVVRDALTRVGWGFLFFLAASFVIYALDAAGWRMAFVAGQQDVAFSQLFSVRMAGEAVNKVTPLASLGGEPLKAYLLARSGASAKQALASVAIAKNTMTLAQIAFIFFGIALALGRLPGDGGILLGFAIFPAVVLLSITITAVIDHRMRRAAPSGPGGGAPRERKGPFGKVLSLWAVVADFFWAHPGAFTLSVLLFFLGWAAGALELLAGAYALGYNLTPRDCLVMEALLVSINMATFLIPANAGTQEGGFAYTAMLLGLTAPAGIALAVLRRCRDVIWIGFGLAYLAITEGRVLFSPRLDTA